MPRLSSTLLVVLSFIFGTLTLADPETVRSVDLDIIYTCPETSTIEIAYENYCPADTNDNEGGQTLTGMGVYANYPNAPSSFQVPGGQMALICLYDAQEYCQYSGGGGQQLNGDTNGPYCRDITRAVPQPSPGVNYRRRALSKRDDFPAASYACPRTASNGKYLNSASLAKGSAAVNEDIYYNCAYSDGVELQNCNYNIDASTGPRSDSDYPESCPRTLCSPVSPVTGNMRRGIYVADSPFVSRQAKMSEVRRRSRMQWEE